jgi:hypothetical protein
MTHDNRITFYVTMEEMQMVKHQAELLGETPSSWARIIVIKELIRQPPHE